MGGIALIARELGHEVTGVDAGAYPPMSTLLSEQGVSLTEGYTGELPDPPPDCILIGNALSRGNPTVEATMTSGLDYQSGPAWLSREVLSTRTVIAVAGTHGKSTTSAMLAHLLDRCGQQPGFLIGAVPSTFSVSARCGRGKHFVIEADEYDSAFFDKRSKFVHYRPHTLILNNLEFDHADIFDNVEAIERQFHHLVRTVPSRGLIVRPALDAHLDRALELGCWSSVQATSVGSEVPYMADWRAELLAEDGSRFMVVHHEQPVASVSWSQTGLHNVRNALAAIAAARHVGVTPDHAVAALCRFSGVKRRMELLADVGGVCVYDDFAHHPTAIKTTLDGLRKKVGDARIIGVLEPRSNTMKMGIHKDVLVDSWQEADEILLFEPDNLGWSMAQLAKHSRTPTQVFRSVDAIIHQLATMLQPGDHVLIMSNGGFGGIHNKLLDVLAGKA